MAGRWRSRAISSAARRSPCPCRFPDRRQPAASPPADPFTSVMFVKGQCKGAPRLIDQDTEQRARPPRIERNIAMNERFHFTPRTARNWVAVAAATVLMGGATWQG